MTTRIVQSLLAIGRLRAANNVALSRKAFSSQISQSYAAPAAGPATSFVQFWYHLYVARSCSMVWDAFIVWMDWNEVNSMKLNCSILNTFFRHIFLIIYIHTLFPFANRFDFFFACNDVVMLCCFDFVRGPKQPRSLILLTINWQPTEL